VIKLVSDFSHGISVFSNNKTDRHDINEILLKVALNTTKKKKHSSILFNYLITAFIATPLTTIEAMNWTPKSA